VKLGKYLLKIGANSKDGYALNLALKHIRESGDNEEWKAFILQLIHSGADTNAKLHSSSTPSLIRAIEGNDVGIVKALLEHGADPNACDNSRTSLSRACRLSKNCCNSCLEISMPNSYTREAMNFMGYQSFFAFFMGTSFLHISSQKETLLHNL
jgi:hypothetical protein